MLGAIVGDVVGSVYEWNNIKTKEFPFFREDCFFTDDTVMTCAVAEAIMNGGQKDNFIDAMKKYGRMYPNADYGARFNRWLMTDNREPYNSFGNGSAMRVSPCGWLGSMDQVLSFARESAECTHNHPEGVKGAQCVAHAIALALSGSGKDAIKQITTETYGYDLSINCAALRESYYFNETCQGTVPQAITCFLESHDFESAIRLSISIGGDSDTLAAITGSIAEAYYGIPKEIEQKALSYLTEEFKVVVRRFQQTFSIGQLP